jgi:hypothetical protein
VQRKGPRLVHFVANVPDLRQALAWLRDAGVERGEVVQVSRETPRGLLQWQISVRADGQRLLGGTLPTLIQWGDTHPAATMPESGVTLHAVCAYQPDPTPLRAAHEAIGLQGVTVKAGASNLCAVLETPRGRVKLESGGL